MKQYLDENKDKSLSSMNTDYHRSKLNIYDRSSLNC